MTIKGFFTYLHGETSNGAVYASISEEAVGDGCLRTNDFTLAFQFPLDASANNPRDIFATRTYHDDFTFFDTMHKVRSHYVSILISHSSADVKTTVGISCAPLKKCFFLNSNF